MLLPRTGAFKKIAAATFTFAVCVVLGSGCTSTIPGEPQVIIDSRMEAGANGQAACGITSQEWLQIGNFGGIGTLPRPVKDKAEEGSGTVTVSCSVVPEGDAFRVSAATTLSGGSGGTITISGLFTPAREPQKNVTVVFNRSDFGRFEQKDCVANYDVNASAGVAAGRIWASVTCPTAVSNTNGDRKCQGTAQFRFETCEQFAPSN